MNAPTGSPLRGEEVSIGLRPSAVRAEKKGSEKEQAPSNLFKYITIYLKKNLGKRKIEIKKYLIEVIIKDIENQM